MPMQIKSIRNILLSLLTGRHLTQVVSLVELFQLYLHYVARSITSAFMFKQLLKQPLTRRESDKLYNMCMY